jgi:LPS-assembly lipoprotein
MSSSDRGSRAGALRFLPAIALALTLGGCFQPLYSEAAHPGLVSDMRAIFVEPIPERFGHYLTSDLISALNGSGSTPEPKYRLKVTLTQSSQTPTVESQINAADAATVTGIAVFVLTPAAGGAPILSGTAIESAVYDRTAQRFANLRAQRDAELRLSRVLASEIELRIASGLAAQH